MFNNNILSVLTSILDFFFSSKVVTTWQTDCAIYKLKPRSFYKFTYLYTKTVDFDFQCKLCLIQNSIIVIILISNWPMYLATLQTYLLLIKILDLILIQEKLKLVSLTYLAILSLTSLIISCFSIIFISLLILCNLIWTLWKLTLQ